MIHTHTQTETMDARFKTPFTMQVSGPSQSGKSFWVGQLIQYKDELFEVPPKSTVWYTPHGQIPMHLPNVEVRSGLPWDNEEEEEEEEGQQDHRLIVLDDYAMETKNSKELTNFFTKYSHHRNISVIQITQNLFFPSSDARTRSLNIHYFVLMRQLRDRRQIQTLARQISQSTKEFDGFMKAYKIATSEGTYNYLLVSLHPRDSPELMLRSHIFPEEAASSSVYLLKKV